MFTHRLQGDPMHHHQQPLSTKASVNEQELAERLASASRVTKLAELDLFDQVMGTAFETTQTVNALDGLSNEDKIHLIHIRAQMRNGHVPNDIERALLDKASTVAEKVLKKLSRRMLRSTKDANVQLLTIMAHSPIYPHSDRMTALKQLDAMRSSDPAMTKDEVDEILGLPLAKAYEKLAELTLLGMITKEQAAQTIKALDARNEAEIRDLKNRFLPQGVPPLPTGALSVIPGGRNGA